MSECMCICIIQAILISIKVTDAVVCGGYIKSGIVRKPEGFTQYMTHDGP